jgi:hypothetical protein
MKKQPETLKPQADKTPFQRFERMAKRVVTAPKKVQEQKPKK